MNWIDVNDYLPEYYKEVIVAYIDKDGKNPGICKASLQGNDKWYCDFSIKGEEYYEEESVITHWFDYQEHLNYPWK